MRLTRAAITGTLESSDIQVTLRPQEGGVTVELDSVVKAQFGEAIEQTVRQTLEEFEIKEAYVQLQDKGALDCVIKARVQCAICRACDIVYNWAREDAQ